MELWLVAEAESRHEMLRAQAERDRLAGCRAPPNRRWYRCQDWRGGQARARRAGACPLLRTQPRDNGGGGGQALTLRFILGGVRL
jgi:hypothetical protein